MSVSTVQNYRSSSVCILVCPVFNQIFYPLYILDLKFWVTKLLFYTYQNWKYWSLINLSNRYLIEAANSHSPKCWWNSHYPIQTIYSHFLLWRVKYLLVMQHVSTFLVSCSIFFSITILYCYIVMSVLLVILYPSIWNVVVI